ncbi:SDR family oxidoreductase [Flammeovirga sp. OC4]|uniref:SDR family oxidoreductase n=1 Tax=Flammeovirga sp. OC4 TaxID=1382345 RepID=UPI000694A1B5|nr:NAD(P)H-binding protein [Flammeovirga sp. OC4]
MIQKIAFIGITGNLAPFTYNELLKKGIYIKALVRNPDKVKNNSEFPKEIEVLKGDLQNLESLRNLFSDVDAIYLNLSTTDANATFQPEVHGIQNVIKIAKEKAIKRIFHVSAITVVYPEFAQGGDLFINSFRKKGYQLLKESNIPVTFFHCSWIMDVMEYAMHKDNKLQGFKSLHHPFFWLAGKDLGKMISNAVMNSDHELTKDYIMQGKNAITFKEALERYAQTFTPQLKVELAPIWLLKGIGMFNREAKKAGQIAHFFSNYKEEFKAGATWLELGEPQLTIENFR